MEGGLFEVGKRCTQNICQKFDEVFTVHMHSFFSFTFFQESIKKEQLVGECDDVQYNNPFSNLTTHVHRFMAVGGTIKP